MAPKSLDNWFKQTTLLLLSPVDGDSEDTPLYLNGWI